MEFIELVNYLHLRKGANICPASISEINDYAGDSVAIRLVQTLKDTVIPQPFENFSPSYVRSLVPVVERADNGVIFLQALSPAKPESLIKKMFDYLILVNHYRARCYHRRASMGRSRK